MTINHLELNGDECRVSVDGKHLQFDNYEIANDVYDILAQMQTETILLELENDKLKKRNKELEYHLMTAKRFNGVEIIYTPNLPVEILNEKTNEKEVFHMIQKGNTLFVSEELYKSLDKRYGGSE